MPSCPCLARSVPSFEVGSLPLLPVDCPLDPELVMPSEDSLALLTLADQRWACTLRKCHMGFLNNEAPPTRNYLTKFPPPWAPEPFAGSGSSNVHRLTCPSSPLPPSRWYWALQQIGTKFMVRWQSAESQGCPSSGRDHFLKSPLLVSDYNHIVLTVRQRAVHLSPSEMTIMHSNIDA